MENNMEQYIQPFIDVSTSVFRDLMQVELSPERVFFVGKNEFQEWDISGIIGLTGEVRGMVAISMKKETAFRITELLTGEVHKFIDEDVVDCTGEIINIIAGNVKKHLEELFKITISLPSIIKGPAHSVVWPLEKTRIVCIPFTIFTDQEICLSVAIGV